MTIRFHQFLGALGILSFVLGFGLRRQAERTSEAPMVEHDPRVPLKYRQASVDDLAESYRHHSSPDTFTSESLAAKEKALWKWIELDGQGALAHAATNHDDTRWHLTDSPQSVLQRWAWRAPKTAMRAALQIEDQDERAQTLGAILDRLTQLGDLDTAIAGAPQIDGLKGTGREFLEAWALQNPKAAGEWFAQLRHPEGEIGVGWTHHLPTNMVLHAFVALNDHWGRHVSTDQDVITVLSQILEGEASDSPQEALLWLTKLSPALLDPKVIQGLIRGWASHSPTDALAFLDSLPENFAFLQSDSANLAQQGKLELARAWSQVEPESAARWILSLPQEAQKPLLDVAAEHFVEHDLEWANQILQTGEEDHPVIVGEWVSKLATESPETAAARLLDHLGDPAYVDAFAELAQTWHQIDSERSARFVASLPPGPNRDGAASGIIGNLLSDPSTDDLESAKTWLATLQPGPLRTDLVTTLVETWKKINPKKAQEALTDLTGSSQP